METKKPKNQKKMIGNQKNNEKFDVLGTKISPEMSEVLNTICDAMQVDVYHLLQWFVYTLIRASSPQHELTPEIRKLMTMLEADTGWQNAFNLVNPKGLRVAQLIMILEQDDRKGFGAVMIDKPFMGEATQTECVDDILERVCEVTMKGIYRRLRMLGADMDCKHLSDVLLTMIDAQDVQNTEESNRYEMQGPADYADNGRRYAYGKKTKSKHHRTPDSLANSKQRTIRFTEEDNDTAREETNDNQHEGIRPFGVEW